MMVFRFIDKMIFAAVLLLGLQVPQLAEHFQQYMSGYFDATADQVEGYAINARQHGFASTDAMIANHLHNTSSSVRTDAEQKVQTLIVFDELSEGMALFQQGNLVQKSLYMFSPARAEMLKATMINFEPGIPLSPMAFLFAVILALLTNLLIASPVYVYQWRKRCKTSLKRTAA